MDDHLIFFVYTFLNTISRIVARQISVRLERRMYAGQKPQEVIPNETENEEDGDDGEEQQEQEVCCS